METGGPFKNCPLSSSVLLCLPLLGLTRSAARSYPRSKTLHVKYSKEIFVWASCINTFYKIHICRRVGVVASLVSIVVTGFSPLKDMLNHRICFVCA